MTPTETAPHGDMIALGRSVGASSAQLAIAGEGNISRRLRPGRIIVTASGSRLLSLAPEHLVEVSTAALTGAVDVDHDDESWLDVILDSRVRPDDLRPTVEVALHAVISESLGAEWILHAHPVDVLAIACSDRLPAFAESRLFPDHIVALGPADMWLPYIDPGRPLAKAVRDGLDRHVQRHGSAPRAILLANHGAFVVGSSSAEVLDRMLMLSKAARVFADGGVVGMSAESIARISGREDERYRQSVLGAEGGRA